MIVIMKIILLLTLLIVSTRSWKTSRVEVENDGTNCIVKGQIRKNLEIWQESGICKSNICFSDKNRFFVESYSCPYIPPPRPPCFIVLGDLTKAWPGCCNKLDCQY